MSGAAAMQSCSRDDVQHPSFHSGCDEALGFSATSPAELPFGAIRAMPGVEYVCFARHCAPLHALLDLLRTQWQLSSEARGSAAGDAFVLADSTLDALLGCATAGHDDTVCQRMQSPAPTLSLSEEDSTCPLPPDSLAAQPPVAKPAEARLAQQPCASTRLPELAVAMLLVLNAVLAVLLLRQRALGTAAEPITPAEPSHSSPRLRPAQRDEPCMSR
jgi:hypothetical protein